MKKAVFLILITSVFAACGNDAKVTVHTDSLGKKFDEKAEKLWDSTKAGLKEAGDKIGEKAEELRDKAKEKLDNIHIENKDSLKH